MVFDPNKTSPFIVKCSLTPSQTVCKWTVELLSVSSLNEGETNPNLNLHFLLAELQDMVPPSWPFLAEFSGWT